VVGKFGNAAFFSRCLRTRVARSGLLEVPGDRKRLRRFSSWSSGSSPGWCCLGGLGIGIGSDDGPSAGRSGRVRVGEAFWIEVTEGRRESRALLPVRALLVFGVGICSVVSAFVDLAASVCRALGGVGCDFLSLLDDVGDSGPATSVSRFRSSTASAAAGSWSCPREFTSLPSLRVIVSVESNACSKSISIRDVLRSVLSLSSATSPCRNDDGGRLGFRTPAPGRNSVPMFQWSPLSDWMYRAGYMAKGAAKDRV
jgi:hypothetical protein